MLTKVMNLILKYRLFQSVKR